MEILIGLILGIPALLFGVRGPPEVFARETEDEDEEDDRVARGAATASGGPEQGADESATRLRIRRATAAGLALWVLTGLVLFSHMARLHPRYVEGFTPAVAALLGIGLAWACTSRRGIAFALLAVGMLVLLYGTPAIWWVVLLGALAAIAIGAVDRYALGADSRRAALWSAAALTAALTAVLAVGVKADIVAIHDEVSDAGFVGQIAGDVEAPMSAYLKAHRRGAKYEVAAESATQIGSLIVKDALPIAVLTTYNGRVFTPVAKLKRMIAAGQVRYAYLSTFCTSHASSVNAACAEPVVWIREHGTDVSAAAGLPKHKLLYLLPGARP